MPMVRHFDHLARIYDHFAGRPNLTVLRDLLGLPIRGWMLDDGGGTGRASYPFLSEVGRIVVVDASFPMLRAARRKDRLLAVKSLAEGLPFSDKCFERILVVDAFHHFHDARRSIGELSRVLKQGGRLVIEEPDLRRRAVKAVALAERLLLMKSRFFYLFLSCACSRRGAFRPGLPRPIDSESGSWLTKPIQTAQRNPSKARTMASPMSLGYRDNGRLFPPSRQGRGRPRND